MEYETNSRYSLYIQSDNNWHHDLTDLDGGDDKESIEARSRVVRQEAKRLLDAFRESLSAIFDCCETRKAAYIAQVKKIRDVSNMATRNAMQVNIGFFFLDVLLMSSYNQLNLHHHIHHMHISPQNCVWVRVS